MASRTPRLDLPAVYAIRDWLAVRAALEAIKTGAQGYAIGGRSVSRADYEQLVARERELAARLPDGHRRRLLPAASGCAGEE